jgi:RimJ/RimL family protein N-acetyltransferase
MSAQCLQLVDGRGVARVLRAMGVHDIGMRLARREDARNLFEWRNAPEIRAISRTCDPIAWETHVSWMDRVLADDNRHLLIGERQGLSVGVVRFDVEGDSAEVSVYKVPGNAEKGIGSDLLAAAEGWLAHHYPSVRSLRAQVLGDNAASHRLFVAADYEAGTAGYFKRMS